MNEDSVNAIADRYSKVSLLDVVVRFESPEELMTFESKWATRRFDHIHESSNSRDITVSLKILHKILDRDHDGTRWQNYSVSVRL